MFKTIGYAAVIAATAAGGHFAVTLAQNFEAEQMRAYQALATPQALASATYDANANQVRAGLRAVDDDGAQWAAAQQAKQ